MRSVSDPIRRTWALVLGVLAVGGVLATGLAIWALGPIGSPSIDHAWSPTFLEAQEPEEAPDLSDETAVFDRLLWTPPEPEPEPVEVAESAAPPPPPDLELIGIVTPDKSETGQWLAIVYDPDSDETHIVGKGQRVGGLTVSGVDATSAAIESDGGPAVLKLETGSQEGGRG